MTRIAIINGHPNDDTGHFVHALARPHAEGARRLYFRQHNEKNLKRGSPQFVGFSPVGTTIIGYASGSVVHREMWLGLSNILHRRGL